MEIYVPKEIVWEILLYLDPRSVVNALGVSKTWNSVSTNMKFFRQLIELNYETILNKFERINSENIVDKTIIKFKKKISYKKLFFEITKLRYQTEEDLYKRFQKLKNFKIHKTRQIALLGQCKAGKSSITLRFVTGNYDEEYIATIEDSYAKQLKIEGKEEVFHIIDTSGSPEYEALLTIVYQENNGFIVVGEVNNEKSILEMIRYLKEIEKIKKMSLEEIPIVLVVNKLDKDDRFCKKEINKHSKSFIRLKEISKHSRIPLFYVSAAKKEHQEKINDIFTSIVKEIKKKRGCRIVNWLDYPIFQKFFLKRVLKSKNDADRLKSCIIS